MTSSSKNPRPGLRVAVLTFVVLAIVALPTALWFGLGEALFGGSGQDIGLTVLIFAVGLGLIWSAQFLWQSHKERRADSRRRQDSAPSGGSRR